LRLAWFVQRERELKEITKYMEEKEGERTVCLFASTVGGGTGLSNLLGRVDAFVLTFTRPLFPSFPMASVL
jgi:hypothetical protein